jgi:hypothetical protein
MSGSGVTGVRERLPAAILALAIQALLLGLLLYAFPLTAPNRHAARETLLLLPRLIQPPPSAAPSTIDARGPARAPVIAPPIFVPPPSATTPPGAVMPAPDVQALGRSLFNCAPENYANLSAEDRARCARPGDGMAVAQPPNLLGGKSHVKDEAHWQEELAREQSPTVLPCMGGLDVLCLLEKVATNRMGDFTDPRTWPRYDVKQIPPEDFKKIEEAYDAWHKAHRDSQSHDSQSHLAPAQSSAGPPAQ